MRMKVNGAIAEAAETQKVVTIEKESLQFL
ncbi:hypothetical protein BN1080_02667 [Planococcus massiliensis]|uniref:Uncharacterized protein n=1 Tax=Planococcus massiliensis TaxID=1499687 RepID=A0A098EN02_9BACL|nr:hypothetical protein BN1080_02667 [Planococcus massiliensis]